MVQEQADQAAQQWMETEMQSELVSMGIASPVTKAAAGARYHQELAAQVCNPEPYINLEP